MVARFRGFSGSSLKIPKILSIILGSVPAITSLLGAIYGLKEQAVGGLVALIFVLLAIWLPTAIVVGIRKLRPKKTVP